MKYAKSSIGISPEIRKRLLGGELVVPVTIASSVFTNTDVVKAGTPITATGVKATTTEGASNAVGILLNDVYKDNPNGALIKAFACINTSVAQTHSGVTYDSATKSALSNIIFE